MSAPLPMALRNRFRDLIEEGLSCSAAALRQKLSRATGWRWGRLIKKQGHAEPARQGRPPGEGKLAPYVAFFDELLTRDPDITLSESRDTLREAEGLIVHPASSASVLSRRGYSFQKIAGGHRAPTCQCEASTG